MYKTTSTSSFVVSHWHIFEACKLVCERKYQIFLHFSPCAHFPYIYVVSKIVGQSLQCNVCNANCKKLKQNFSWKRTQPVANNFSQKTWISTDYIQAGKEPIPDICHGHHGQCPCKKILSGVTFSRLNAKKCTFDSFWGII